LQERVKKLNYIFVQSFSNYDSFLQIAFLQFNFVDWFKKAPTAKMVEQIKINSSTTRKLVPAGLLVTKHFCCR